MKRSEILFAALLLPLDFLAVMGSFALSYWLRSFTDLIPGVQLPVGEIPLFVSYLSFLWKAGLLFVVVGITQGVYIIQNRASFSRELPKVFITALIWFAAVLAWFFLRRAFFFSRLVLIYGFIFSIVALLLLRLLLKLAQHILFSLGIGKTRVLILGTNVLADNIYKELMRNSAYRVIGCLKQGIFFWNKGITCPVIGNINHFQDIVKNYYVEEVIQTQGHISNRKTEEIMSYCQEHRLRYRFLPDILELHQINVSVQAIAGLPIIELKRTPLDGWGRLIKRIADIVGASFSLIVFSPIFLITTIAIKLESRGPIFFRQERISQGKRFNIYKFRSMVADAETKKALLMKQNERKGPLFKIKDDPRVTKLGMFLRKWSIDELPQLINVFIGDMSMVGPRPHLESEIELYAKHHKKVLVIKSGITGMAQVSGRSNLDFEEEVHLDTFYVENWSLWMDIRILLRTVYVVLFRSGKY